MKYALQLGGRTVLHMLLGLASATCHAQLDATSAQRLQTLKVNPQVAGELIYRGDVSLPGTPSPPLWLSYERRLLPNSAGWRAAHITRETSGSVIIEESAELTPRYAIRRFEAINQQQGSSGFVRVSEDGHQLTFQLTKDGTTRTATETVSDPVVAGPSIFGFILENWDVLQRGGAVPVRMLVLSELQTYGFEIRQERRSTSDVVFSIAPSSWLVRLMVAPLSARFDARTRHPLGYEGRVPPMREVDGKLRDTDARVVYAMQVSTYR